jgi:Mn2+/Fe2+ NRAMP family transporter
VFFFSSGGVEDHWTPKDLVTERTNVFIGFPLGGLLTLAIMGCAAVVLRPLGVQVGHLSQMGLPVALAVGKVGVAFALVGFVAATFGAALETTLSAGYTVAQYFGWQWGKFVRPKEAARFHALIIIALIAGALVGLTTIDPIKITEYSIVFSAAALPLTYFPILVIANDPDYMRDKTNSRLTNAIGTVYLIVVVVASAAAIPLMLATKAGL